jgi:predicted nucleic acid-binding protein
MWIFYLPALLLLMNNSASNLILGTAELTLIEAITSVQIITEVERNLIEKMPKALPAFQRLISRC